MYRVNPRYIWVRVRVDPPLKTRDQGIGLNGSVKTGIVAVLIARRLPRVKGALQLLSKRHV